MANKGKEVKAWAVVTKRGSLLRMIGGEPMLEMRRLEAKLNGQ